MSPTRRGRGTRGRRLSVAVKTAKGRKPASTRWLQRQLNDPYVTEALRRGYRSRSAFKLIQLDDKYRFLRPGARVVDLGAAPGGWTQVAVERTKAAGKGTKRGRVVAIDLLPMTAVEGAAILECDFLAEDAPALMCAALGGPADVVMSDMSPNATGHSGTDHLRIVVLCEAALAFARQVLKPGGAFVAKLFQGGAQGALMADLKRDFATVRHAKPPASRPESSELYIVALGFRAMTD
ncbi:MAG: RlmE family RNA methyltransferase [Alphaproteobacteria bacterium]